MHLAVVFDFLVALDLDGRTIGERKCIDRVLVKEKDLKNTLYTFTLEDGSTVELKGDEEIEYDGEIHTAANLFDALKEGYYGKF